MDVEVSSNDDGRGGVFVVWGDSGKICLDRFANHCQGFDLWYTFCGPVHYYHVEGGVCVAAESDSECPARENFFNAEPATTALVRQAVLYADGDSGSIV